MTQECRDVILTEILS